MSTKTAQAYTPRTDVATLHARDDAGWYVQLDPNATVVELALLMKGIGNTAAIHVGGGAFAIVPRDKKLKAPTAAQLAEILERQMNWSQLPMLVGRS